MHQTALKTTPLHQPSAGNAYDVRDDPTRGLEDAPADARRDPTAGAPANLQSDPTRGLEDRAPADARRDPTAGAPANLGHGRADDVFGDAA
jgi:hypothetical protein